jgi:hypothetical protein
VAFVASAPFALVAARLALTPSQGILTALKSSLGSYFRRSHFGCSHLNLTPLKLGLNSLDNYLLRNLVAHFFYMEENYFYLIFSTVQIKYFFL